MFTHKFQPLASGSTIDHATLAKFGLKRPYKSDLKPFNDIFSQKNLALTVLKAAIVPMNNVVNEFNSHVIAQNGKEEDEDVEDFDWNASIKRNAKLFLPMLYRVSAITLIKKALEEAAAKYLSDKVADRLVKDIGQSIIRKCKRFPNRLVACRKIFFTAFWANTLLNASLFLYDTAVRLYEEFTDHVRISLPLQRRIKNLTYFIVRKGGTLLIYQTSSAVGYAFGSYFDYTYMGPICGAVFELIAAALVPM